MNKFQGELVALRMVVPMIDFGADLCPFQNYTHEFQEL
jgi:hypothetical protein